MIIIVGGKPDVHGAARLSERVGSMHAHKHYVCASLVQNAVCMWCALCRCVKKGFCEVTGEKTDVRESQGWDTDKKRKYEEVRWSLSRSSLAVRCAGVSAFHFPIVGVLGLIAITTTHCTVHHHTRTRVLVWHGLILGQAWASHTLAWSTTLYRYLSACS